MSFLTKRKSFPASKKSCWAWFLGLYAASVLAMFSISFLIHVLIAGLARL